MLSLWVWVGARSSLGNSGSVDKFPLHVGVGGPPLAEPWRRRRRRSHSCLMRILASVLTSSFFVFCLRRSGWYLPRYLVHLIYTLVSPAGLSCRCRPACPCSHWSYRPVRSISHQPMYTHISNGVGTSLVLRLETNSFVSVDLAAATTSRQRSARAVTACPCTVTACTCIYTTSDAIQTLLAQLCPSTWYQLSAVLILPFSFRNRCSRCSPFLAHRRSSLSPPSSAARSVPPRHGLGGQPPVRRRSLTRRLLHLLRVLHLSHPQRPIHQYRPSSGDGSPLLDTEALPSVSGTRQWPKNTRQEHTAKKLIGKGVFTECFLSSTRQKLCRVPTLGKDKNKKNSKK